MRSYENYLSIELRRQIILEKIKHPCGSCHPKTCNFNEPTDTCDIFKEYLKQVEEECKKCKEKFWNQCSGQCEFNYTK